MSSTDRSPHEHHGDSHHPVTAHDHSQGHGHSHGHGHDEHEWDGEAYLKRHGVQETAVISHDAVIYALEGAGITKDQIKEMNVLEIGCGAGAVTQHLVKSFASVHAIDVSPSMLIALSKRLPKGVTYALHSLSPESPKYFENVTPMFSPTEDNNERKLAPPRKQFDIAVANLVVHHVHDLDSFMAGVFGLIKPGGWFVITEFGKEEKGIDVAQQKRMEMQAKHEKMGHIHASFTKESIVTFLEKYGFVEIWSEIKGTLPVWKEADLHPPSVIARGRKP